MSSNRKEVRIFNQHLKFSWSHIIAFIGLIAAAYIMFMGFTYMTGGGFVVAGVASGVIVALLAWVFIGVQQLKATDHKFDRSMRRERVMLCLTPYVLALAMWPVSHFWAVRAHDAEIVELFTESVGTARQLFTDYEDYAAKRTADYHGTLSQLVSARHTEPERYAYAGFKGVNDSVQMHNMETTLRLQLLSSNYTRTRDEALAWIDAAGRGASTWNIFLIGNTRQIKDAVTSWHDTLEAMSARRMSNEDAVTDRQAGSFAGSSRALEVVMTNIDTVSESYRHAGGGWLSALLFGAVMYMFLIFPYLVQRRNTRSMLTLFGRRSSLGGDAVGTYHDESPDMDAADSDHEPKPAESRHVKRSYINDDDDYQVF